MPTRDRLRLFLVSQGAELLGEDLFVQKLSIEGVFRPGLVLEGVTVHSRNEQRLGQPLVRLDRLELRLGSVVRLLRGTLPVELFEVVRPALRAAVVEGKLRDFHALSERLAQPGTGEPMELRLDVLRVVSASARLTVTPPGLGASLSGFELDFRQDRRGSGVGQLGVETVEVYAGQLRERAELRSGTFAVDQGVVSLVGYSLVTRTGEIALDGVVNLKPTQAKGRSGPVSYSLNGEGDLDLGTLRDAWPALPNLAGQLAVRVGVSGQGLDPKGTFIIRGEGVGAQLMKHPKKRWVWAGDPTLIGSYEDGRLLLSEQSSVLWGGGRVRLGGDLEFRGELPWKVDLEFQDLALEKVLDSVTVPGAWVALGLNGEAQLQGRIRGGFHGEGSAKVRATDLFVYDKAWDSEQVKKQLLHVPWVGITTGITLGPKNCLLAPATLRGPGSTLQVSADFLFLRPLGLNIQARAETFDARALSNNVVGVHVEGAGGLEAHIEGQTRDLDIRGSLELEDFVLLDWPFGRVGGDVHWHVREPLKFTGMRGLRGDSDFDAEVVLHFADVRRGGERERLEIGIEAQVSEGRGHAEDLLPIFFGDAVPMVGPVWGEARLFGPPSELSGWGWVQGKDVRYLWEEFDSLDVQAQVREGDLFVEEGFARKPSGNSVFGRGSIARNGAVDFEFRLPRMGLDEVTRVATAFPVPPDAEPSGPDKALSELTGQLSGSAVLTGELRDVHVQGRLHARDVRYRGMALGNSSLHVAVAEHRVRTEASLLGGSLDAEADLLLEGLWPYSFALRSGNLTLDPYLPRRVLARTDPVRAGAAGDLQGNGTLKDGWHDVVLTLDDLFLQRGPHRVQAAAGQPLVLRYEGGAYRFEHFVLTGTQGRTDLEVAGWIRPSGPLAVTVHGAADASFVDLAYDVFDRVEAQSLQVALDISGMSPESVDVEGTAELRSALIKTTYFPHPLEVESMRVRLLDRRLTFESLDARLGGGQISGFDGSYILLDRTGYRPRNYGLKAKCTDCTLKYPSFLPQGRGDLNLQFMGTSPDQLVLRGSIDVAEMVLREPLNWTRSVFTFRESATENLAGAESPGLFDFDIDVRSKPGGLRIDNNLGTIRGTAQSLHVGGNTSQVLLSGATRIESGIFPWKGRDFTLEPGVARFEAGGSWFPSMELNMWTDVSNREETYRISYTIVGPLDAPQLNATSSPYLAEADIHNLLLFGLTQEQLAEADLAGVLAAAGGAGLGTLGETAATSFRASMSGAGQKTLPDRLEIVPVYTETTGATTVWAVLTKEVVPGLLTLEGGIGYTAGGRTVDSVGRLQLRFLRNLYLEASWLRDDQATQDYGNFGLDMKFELDLD